MKKYITPAHPGKILSEEFLIPMNISQYRLAIDIAVSPRRINEIVHGTRAITADTSLRLSRYFGNSPEFWLNLQKIFEIRMATIQSGEKIEKEVKILTTK